MKLSESLDESLNTPAESELVDETPSKLVTSFDVDLDQSVTI
jgi:hypothetical protein